MKNYIVKDSGSPLVVARAYNEEDVKTYCAENYPCTPVTVEEARTAYGPTSGIQHVTCKHIPQLVNVLPVSVLRDADLGDCTNGGESSKSNTLYIPYDGGFMSVYDDDPRLFRVIARKFSFSPTEYLSAVPYLEHDGRGAGPMMGGNFIWSCDSRFPADYPIPVHDRYE